MSMNSQKLGILAGGGRLPEIIVEACKDQGFPYFVVGFKDFTDETWLKKQPHEMSRLASIGKTIKALKKAGVKRVVFAGTIRRPSLSNLVPDIKGAKILARLSKKGRLGDDALLKELTLVLEEEGLEVVGAHEIHPDLLTSPGILTKSKPTKKQTQDINDAMTILSDMAKHDVGQGCVMQEGLVLGIEAIEGTTALIDRCATYKRKGDKPVLIKRMKTGQDTRFDLPTIGTHTIEKLFEGGYGGVALESGATIILDRQAVLTKADHLGLFVIGVQS